MLWLSCAASEAGRASRVPFSDRETRLSGPPDSSGFSRQIAGSWTASACPCSGSSVGDETAIDSLQGVNSSSLTSYR